LGGAIMLVIIFLSLRGFGTYVRPIGENQSSQADSIPEVAPGAVKGSG